MNENTIHVLVCTYQGEAFIAEQLDSILSQSYASIEIHVFDDASTDDTNEIVQSYCEAHENIFLHKNKENSGFLKNFENALNSSTGKYIALSDQDDIWHTEKLTESMQALKELENTHKDVALLIHTDLSLIDSSGAVLHDSFFEKKGIQIPQKKSLPKILGHCGVMGNTILMNRTLVDMALPFPDGLKYHDYWLAVVTELVGRRRTLSKALVKYRIHSKNSSNNSVLKKPVSFDKENIKKSNFHLPFMEDNRESAIKNVLENYKIPEYDRKLLSQFHDYLLFKGRRFPHYLFILRNGFLKDDRFYRLSVFFRIMLTSRYVKKASDE